MQQDILINWSPQETRVAVIEHGALQELQVERSLERGLVGNVYLGKVARVLSPRKETRPIPALLAQPRVRRVSHPQRIVGPLCSGSQM